MKIGLLALSGLRAHDPELLALGMTLPGVIERGKVLKALPSLGLLYLAALTPEGHDIRYFETEGEGWEPDELYSCDLVAINTFSAQVFEAYAIADRLRAAGVVVAMGGLHVTVEPHEALAHADIVVLGEGEKCWANVVQAVQAGNFQPVWDFRSAPPVDVSELPIPRYDLLQNRPYTRYPVQTTRGCPWRCEFCASNVMFNHPYRKRPVQQVMRDIDFICSTHKRPFIEFADDNTFVDHDWGKDLCRALIPRRIKWFTETDISLAQNSELLQLMRRARCQQVLIGLESPEKESLNGIECRANFKHRQEQDYITAIRTIQEHGITVNGCFILGLDNHDETIFEQVYEFATRAELWEVQITVLTPFPGTPLYARFSQAGRILQPGRWDLCTLFDVNFQPAKMSVDQLRSGMRWLAAKLYSAEGIANRRRTFFENVPIAFK
ncbi:MAG: B12-binding domain-containing radical SAM protein [Planctomycetales bacterium]|nr:B12-binding domain-containing radical SAM protein [Planctomycetales bacterium]